MPEFRAEEAVIHSLVNQLDQLPPFRTIVIRFRTSYGTSKENAAFISQIHPPINFLNNESPCPSCRTAIWCKNICSLAIVCVVLYQPLGAEYQPACCGLKLFWGWTKSTARKVGTLVHEWRQLSMSESGHLSSNWELWCCYSYANNITTSLQHSVQGEYKTSFADIGLNTLSSILITDLHSASSSATVQPFKLFL